ncbi:hypothetical protein ACOMHN_034367 [Nucella lapillus]
MQLLTMTTQKGQEGDSQADDPVSQATPDPDQVSQTSTEHPHLPEVHQHRASAPHDDSEASSPFCILLLQPYSSSGNSEHTCILPQQSDLPHSSDFQPQNASTQLSGNRQEMTRSGTGQTSVSSALCNHEFCHQTDSLEEWSSSPDVNCNTLTTPRFKTAPTSLCSADRGYNSLVLEQVAPDGTLLKISSDTIGPENQMSFGSMANGGKHNRDLQETTSSAEGSEMKQVRTQSSSWIASPKARTGSIYADGGKRCGEDEIFTTENRGLFYPIPPQVNNNEHIHEPQTQQENWPVTTIGSHKSSSYVCSTLPTNHQEQRKEAEESDLSLRNSVDMDIEEESDTDEENVVNSGKKSFTPYIPQTAADNTGLAGRDHPTTSMDTLLDKLVNSSVKTTLVSIPVKRSVLTISLESTNLHLIPPIWTTLALRSAAKSVRGSRISPNTQQMSPIVIQPVPPTTNDHTQCISDSILSEETIEENLNHNISISLKMIRPNNRLKCTPFGNHNHANSSGFRSSSTTSKRSPLHGIFKPKHGKMASCALKKNTEAFFETLLEDECALYAGRLQSIFKNPASLDCDRKEIPDPVATILNEGDDMHFIPICEDSTTRGCRPTLEDSKFASSIPLWESVA